MTFRRALEFANFPLDFAGIVVPQDIINLILRIMLDLREIKLPLYESYEFHNYVGSFRGAAIKCGIASELQFCGFKLLQYELPASIKRQYDNELWRPSYKCCGMKNKTNIHINVMFGCKITVNDNTKINDKDFRLIKLPNSYEYFFGRCVDFVEIGSEDIYDKMTRVYEDPKDDTVLRIQEYGEKYNFKTDGLGVYYVDY